MPRRAQGHPVGKLIAVATAWAKGRGAAASSDPATDAAAEALAARAARRDARERGAEIGPDEIDAVTLFHGLASQWRVHPMGGRIGFDYAAIGPTAALMGIEMTPAIFVDLRLMEGAALAAFPRP